MHRTAIEASNSSLALSQAILLYTTTGSGREIPAYATRHPVTIDAGGNPEIGAGTALTEDTLRKWHAQIHRATKPELLPENVLVSHQDMLIWWVPAQTRTAWFNISKNHLPEDARHLTEETVQPVPYPAHLFAVVGRTFHVYALKTNKRPTPDTVLHHSPVLNVFSNSTLCWGNIKNPGKPILANIPLYERAVFDSWSTHPNPGQNQAIRYQGGLIALWDFLIDIKANKFPGRTLKPVTSTIASDRPRPKSTKAPPLTLDAFIQGKR